MNGPRAAVLLLLLAASFLAAAAAAPSGEYRFVYVNEDGSVREVTILEKLFLQTKYSGGDGARPYIKTAYAQKDSAGRISGFCYREFIPAGIEIRKIVDQTSRETAEAEIRRIRGSGYDIDLTGITLPKP